jgi:hypothetical protein
VKAAMKTIAASSAKPTATSLANNADRCARLNAEIPAGVASSGPSPCSNRCTT